MATNNSVNSSLSGTTGSGNFVGSTSPSITTPKIVSQVLDTNGNPIIGLGVTSSAVNYLTITNQSTGTPPFLSASGNDTNISINIAPKGTGLLNLITEATTNPLTIVSGTGSQHVTTFNFSDTSASQAVTFPDESGTVQFVKSSPTMQVFTSGSGTYTTPTGVKYIKIEMVGGGGGGSASGVTPPSGTNTTFGTSLLTANTNSGRTGGGYTINSPAYGFGVTGGTGGQNTAWSGATFTIQGAGGIGGSSYFGGSNSAYGAGGEGALVSAGGTASSGFGGGAGGYICAYIDSPSSSYSYTVGTGGTGGSGTDGASGIIIVTEYYQ